MTSYNCVQQSLIPGSHRAGFIEYTADCLNIFPACMWGEKSVRVYEVEGELYANYGYRGCSEIYSERSCFEIFGRGGGGAACAILGIGYAITSILASPFLATGLCLKKIALCGDENALKYNQLAMEHLMKDATDLEYSISEEFIADVKKLYNENNI